MEDLNRGVFLPDLLVWALRRDPQRPAIFLDEEVLSVAQLGAQISRYAQAYAALWPGSRQRGGHAVAANRARGAVRHRRLHALRLPWRATARRFGGRSRTTPTCLKTPASRRSCSTRASPGAPQGSVTWCPSLTRLLSFGPNDVGDDLTALAAAYQTEPLVAPSVDPEAISSLAYTGGTTGEPKGVMSTYRSGAAMVAIMLTEWRSADLRHLVCTPLSHAGAAFVVPALVRGRAVVVLSGFDAGRVLAAIERYRITSLFLVPSMIYALLDHPAFPATDLSSLETVFYGASPISPARLREAIATIGPVFFQFYGQTEAAQTVCVLRKEEHDPDDLARLATCGRPVPLAARRAARRARRPGTARRGWRDLRARAAGHERLLEQA